MGELKAFNSSTPNPSTPTLIIRRDYSMDKGAKRAIRYRLLVAVLTLVSLFSLALAHSVRAVSGGFELQEIHVNPLKGNDKWDGSVNEPLKTLQAALTAAKRGGEIILRPGVYEGTTETLTEPVAGNSLEPLTKVQFTAGFHIGGTTAETEGEETPPLRTLVIRGTNREKVVLKTNAGYGVYIENYPHVRIENLTITGGKRDADGAATSGAIVVRHSYVEVSGVNIVDNTDYIEKNIVGIIGIAGREGAILSIHDNVIHNNSWDGIALYRGATALIFDNHISIGRGAGIGITWDSKAIVYRNLITGYWKGIGTFGESWAAVRNNIVYRVLGWGIIASGDSTMECMNNLVAFNGNVGVAAWNENVRMKIVNNVILGNGTEDQWVAPLVGIWSNAKPENVVIKNNDVWMNAQGNYLGIDDLTGKDGNISIDPGILGLDRLGEMLDPITIRPPKDSAGIAVPGPTVKEIMMGLMPEELFRTLSLDTGSPLIDAGDPMIIDPDGTVSDLGPTGGWSTL